MVPFVIKWANQIATSTHRWAPKLLQQ
jgi:hypothetical protein